MKKRNKADSYHTASLLRLVFFVLVIFTAGFYSCTVNKQVSKAATTILLKDSAIATGHIGICIYEPQQINTGTIITAAIILYRQVIPSCLHCMPG